MVHGQNSDSSRNRLTRKREELQETRKTEDKKISPELAKKLEELREWKERDKRISPVIVNVLETLARIEDGIAHCVMKPVFTLPDVWRMLGGKDANSAEAKRAQRDLPNLLLIGKIHILKDVCPTCGHEFRGPRYSLQSFEEQVDWSQ